MPAGGGPYCTDALPRGEAGLAGAVDDLAVADDDVVHECPLLAGRESGQVTAPRRPSRERLGLVAVEKRYANVLDILGTLAYYTHTNNTERTR